LLQADAGEVIRAFGRFVVQGNYIVGAVIFLILAIIQFIVIAKGSERVAEVGARFVLDAMPGKQMAIDAELRSGGIDATEAKRRRRALERESQFYGAMDGAMKFVKGDVIASFIITIINIAGGLSIGVLQRNLELGVALKRYGLLTIGDGLVSQIPALVIATAAGILVTRVASEDAERPLGAELASQIFGQPRALRVAGVFVLVLALLPGLPALPFLFIGALLVVASRVSKQSPHARAGSGEPNEQADDAIATVRFIPVVVPWALDVSSDFERLLDDDVRAAKVRRLGLSSVARLARDSLFHERGVPLPAARVSVSGELPERTVILQLHEVPAKVIQVPAEVSDSAIAEFVASEVLGVLSERAADFVGIAQTQNLLDHLEQIAPATVRQVVPKPISVTLLSEVLRRLVEEGISIRDLRAILEALAQTAEADRDPLRLTEFVRSQLRRPITHTLTGGGRELEVYLLEHHVEETIRSAISRTGAGSFLTLAPAAGRDIVTAARRAVSAHPTKAGPPVLLTQPDIRRFLRKLIETDLPEAKVVSYAELLPEVTIKPLGRVTLSGV
jgi:type III secretion protein V